jgi:hypothetical protein
MKKPQLLRWSPTYNTIYTREEADGRTSPHSSMCYYEFQPTLRAIFQPTTHIKILNIFIRTSTQTISDDEKSPPGKHPTPTTTDVKTN